MKKRALLIGINQYHLLGNLSYARQDAEAVAEALFEHYGFSRQDITLMTCQSEGATLGLSRYIEHALMNLTAEKDIDLLVFGFWGHGFAPVSARRYLCGVDTAENDLERTAVSMDVVKAKLAQIQAENTLLILDCCQNRPTGRSASAEPMTQGEEATLASMARDIQAAGKKQTRDSIPTVAILNACREGQKAYEWNERGHGIFTAYLLDAFEQGFASIAPLSAWLFDRVAKTSRDLHQQSQTPYIMIEGKGDILLPTAVPSQKTSSGINSIHIGSKYEADLEPPSLLRREIQSDFEEVLHLIRARKGLKSSFFEKQKDRIQRWRKGAEYGWPEAQYLWGRYQQFNKNPVDAVKWYRKAAEQGNAEAQYQLSTCYHFGSGVSKNIIEKAKWLRKAAEQGHASAQYQLGSYYSQKETHADYVEAVKWYRKAAEQGDDGAQFSLGVCYSNGDGVPENKDEAAKWYRKAVEQGGIAASKAQEFLSEITENDDRGVSFICPGCGDRATGVDGKLCPKCKAFVHKECLSKGKKVRGGFGDWLCGIDKWQAVCPVCRSVLGTFEKFETFGGGYAQRLDDSDE